MARHKLNAQELSEKEAFSQRLKQQLLQHGWPSNSPTWLAREFNIRYSGNSVSIQTASNWLSGTAIPNQDKLQVLAAWLDVSSQWFRFGEQQDPIVSSDDTNAYKNVQLYLDDLPQKISQLTPKQKQLVYDMVKVFLALQS